tara:strand:- start:4550 stop:4729 length:180 start_codon:yes stop_codon:yes gene_type:complete
MTSSQLIDELDQLNPAPVISGPIDESKLQELVYQAGRRSLVNELVYLKKKMEDQDGFSS